MRPLPALFSFICLIAGIVLLTCSSGIKTTVTQKLLDTAGAQVNTRFMLPDSFRRLLYAPNSFESYLAGFSLKPHGSKVYLYNGLLKGNQGVAAAVLDIDVGFKDLQQCADAVMRLRAEYLYAQKKYPQIHFKFTNGFEASYSKWAAGYRIKVNGNQCSWYRSGGADFSYTTFKKYLEMVFSYAGSLSLSKELKQKSIDSIAPGDVFIIGGSPGHAVIVMDVAVHKRTGKRLAMLAQSYMPAQNIHILKNPNSATLSPWYDLAAMEKVITPEWTFTKDQLKEF